MNSQIIKLNGDIADLQDAIFEEKHRIRRQQNYRSAYDAFSFVLGHSPTEARQQLERLYQRFPDHLRNEPRLQSDFRRLLRTETTEFEHRLRAKLGL